MRRIAFVALMLATAPVATDAWAQTDRSSVCVNAVNRCFAVFSEKGAEYALKTIDDNTVIVDQEPYVFALDMSNVMLAHPHRHDWKGRDMTSMKDANNKEIFKAFKAVAETGKPGWVECLWLRPGEDKPRLKRTYISKVPGHNIYIGAGYYPTTDAKSPPPDAAPGFEGSSQDWGQDWPGILGP